MKIALQAAFVAVFLFFSSAQAAQEKHSSVNAAVSAAAPAKSAQAPEAMTLSKLIEMAMRKSTSASFGPSRPADPARIRTELKLAWLEYSSQSTALAILEEHRALLQTVTDSAESRFRVGQGNQDIVLLAQVELLNLERRKVELEGLIDGSKRSINLLISNPLETDLGKPSQEKEIADLPYTLDELLELALKHSRAAEAQSQSGSEAQAQSSGSSIPSSLVDEYGKASTSLRLVRLHDTSITPLAEAAMESAFEAYQSGKGELRNLTDAVLALLDSRMKRLESAASYRKALTRMEQLVGIELLNEKESAHAS